MNERQNIQNKDPNFRLRRAMAATVLGVAVFGVAKGPDAVDAVRDYATNVAHDQLDEQNTVTVTVEKGGALYHVAAELNPSGDPRRLVDAIKYLNRDVAGVEDNFITPGTELEVPVALLGDEPQVSVDLENNVATVSD